MEDQKQQIAEKLRAANNILVTVSRNPSVDQLAACIGLTLLLNKMGKHATAVFSGKVPSTIEFLQPEDTIEKNTDSLRDFIIAIDKAKADKLRYKVEDEIVKIFITPYKSSISEKDLIFSQGDFNVDVVVALGVHQQQDLDDAITAHGRILHDAVVISVNNTPNGNLGTIEWQDLRASGVAELVTGLSMELGENNLDGQIATALLTGIVAETAHFSNQKTTPQTMTASAALLAAGANQQLVARELDNPITNEASRPASITEPAAPADDDQLKISHDKPANDQKGNKPDSKQKDNRPQENKKKDGPKGPQKDAQSAPDELPKITEVKALAPETLPMDNPELDSIDALLKQADEEVKTPGVTGAIELPEPKPTASESSNADEKKTSAPEPAQPPQPAPAPAQPAAPAPQPIAPPAPNPVLDLPPLKSTPSPLLDKGDTLTDIEAAVHSPHVDTPPPVEPVAQPAPATPTPDASEEDVVDSARKAVEDALRSNPTDEPLAALNAIPVDLNLGHEDGAENAPVAPAANAAPAGPVPADTPVVSDGGLPGYLQTPPPTAPPAFGPPPQGGAVLPHNPAANEQAPLSMSPADQPFTMPLPPSVTMPPPQTMPPTSSALPPQGPPPPPVPPPMPPGMPL